MNKKFSFTNIINARYTPYIFLFLIILFFVSNYSKIYDIKPDMNGDNIYYYSLGKALTEGKGFTNTMSFTESPHTHFPPGYPVFVAGIMKVFPANIEAIKIANGVLLCLSILLLFFLLKKLSGNIILPMFTCLLCCMHSELLRYATIMMSETLFILLSISAVCMALSIEAEQLFSKKGWADKLTLLGLIICINYIYFVRTMGASVILAVIFYYGIVCIKQFILYLRNKKKEAHSLSTGNRKITIYYLIIFLVSFASFAGTKYAWDLRNQHVGKTDNDYIKDFNKKPKGETMETWKDWTERMQQNFGSYITKWIPVSILHIKEEDGSNPSDWFRGVGTALLLILGLIKLREGSLLLFLYIGATMGVLLVWPEQYGGLRYFLAIIPFFIFLFLNGLKECIEWGVKLLFKKTLPVLWQTACLLLFILIFMYPAYTRDLKEEQIMAEYKSWKSGVGGMPLAEYISAIEWCAANLPNSARIACRKPELFYLYSGGRKSIGFPQYGNPEEIFTFLNQSRVTHIIIDRWFRHGYVTIYPLIRQYYPDNFKGLCQIGGKKNNEPPTLVFEFNPDWGYKGDWVDGKRQGKGSYRFQDGRLYTGHFENDQFEGYGEFYDAKGDLLYKGIWKKGAPVEQQ